jgi:hypothetical protein
VAGLLLEHVAGGWLRRFAFQREMHALVAPVVLWMPGRAALDLNPEAYSRVKRTMVASRGARNRTPRRPASTPMFIRDVIKKNRDNFPCTR